MFTPTTETGKLWTKMNGAPLEVTDADGAVRWSGQYGSFGEVSHQTAESWALRQGKPTINQPLRYAGQYADSETGLHYNLFRYYDPGVGRFTIHIAQKLSYKAHGKEG